MSTDQVKKMRDSEFALYLKMEQSENTFLNQATFNVEELSGEKDCPSE